MPAWHTGKQAQPRFKPKTVTLRPLASAPPPCELELTLPSPNIRVGTHPERPQGPDEGSRWATSRGSSGPMDPGEEGPLGLQGEGPACECVQGRGRRPDGGRGPREGQPQSMSSVVPAGAGLAVRGSLLPCVGRDGGLAHRAQHGLGQPRSPRGAGVSCSPGRRFPQRRLLARDTPSPLRHHV